MKKNLLRLLALFVLALTAAHAADDKLNAAVRAADDERVAATKAGDRKRLEAIYSKDLHYAHSSGKIDTQASYIDSLVKRTTIYEKYDYQTREFRPAGPGIFLMIARVLINATANGQKISNDLNILAVWREEQGKWRFLAWQSCKNPPADAAAAAKK